MTDWKAIGAAQGVAPNEAHVALMEQLEAVMVELKKGLPAETEPAPVFRAVEGAEQ